ncbi:MAG: hypothetical protein HYW25_01340 [Candidatus Aenigmarchaeota archaeon]|nr:hypothetical protein [Candidatus Aenigmarchaeota archaeon]
MFEFIREAVREKLLSTSVKTLPDDIAENEIRWFLQEKRKTGQNLVSIIEISQELMLPPGQTERIMSRLKGVKEV